MRRWHVVLSMVLLGFLVGCATPERYAPYTKVHPRTGASVRCGHWIWWECATAPYREYVRVGDPVETKASNANR